MAWLCRNQITLNNRLWKLLGYPRSAFLIRNHSLYIILLQINIQTGKDEDMINGMSQKY
jgi:hypothetical protein